ncbi:MAG: hypothetical protein V1839_02230 [archaeon]
MKFSSIVIPGLGWTEKQLKKFCKEIPKAINEIKQISKYDDEISRRVEIYQKVNKLLYWAKFKLKIDKNRTTEKLRVFEFKNGKLKEIVLKDAESNFAPSALRSKIKNLLGLRPSFCSQHRKNLMKTEAIYGIAEFQRQSLKNLYEEELRKPRTLQGESKRFACTRKPMVCAVVRG